MGRALARMFPGQVFTLPGGVWGRAVGRVQLSSRSLVLSGAG